MHDAGYMGEIEGGEEGSPSGVLPPPPASGTPVARTRRTTGCVTTLFVTTLTAFLVLIIVAYREEKTHLAFSITDKHGTARAFQYSWFVQHVGVLVFVGLLCLVVLAVAIVRDRRRQEARTACIVLLMFSAIAVVGGMVVLRSHPGPVTCQACLHPDSYGSCLAGNGLSLHTELQDVPCPASYEAGAHRVIRAIDRQFVILIVVGGICALAGIVLLFRSLRRRSKALAAGVP